MTLLTAFSLLLCLSCLGHARPSRTVPYFPRYHPWERDDPETTLTQYVYPQEPAENHVRGRSAFKTEAMNPNVPVYPKSKGGYFPPSLSSLDSVYWWNKRFNSGSVPSLDDSPDLADDDISPQGGVEKRDYTAAQLVNMLKALAKARRQRGIRVAGKALRFGISR